jgi:DnaJ-domain-containing protein 1
MFKGKVLTGAVMMAGAILWAAWRRGKAARAVPKSLPLDEARQLLGVQEGASLEEIRAAHRRLISKVHPDAGGSADLANRVNAARDTLVAEMNRKPPQAS